jgi:hypothetical protein
MYHEVTITLPNDTLLSASLLAAEHAMRLEGCTGFTVLLDGSAITITYLFAYRSDATAAEAVLDNR